MVLVYLYKSGNGEWWGRCRIFFREKNFGDVCVCSFNYMGNWGRRIVWLELVNIV